MTAAEAAADNLIRDLAATTSVLEEAIVADDDQPFGRVSWGVVFARYRMLSTGEQAVVNFACSLAGRQVQGGSPLLGPILGAVDEYWQERMAAAFAQAVGVAA